MINNKYIIKFEAGLLEQVYKVSEMDVSGQKDIEEMLDDVFLSSVIQRFKEMSLDFGKKIN